MDKTGRLLYTRRGPYVTLSLNELYEYAERNRIMIESGCTKTYEQMVAELAAATDSSEKAVHHQLSMLFWDIRFVTADDLKGLMPMEKQEDKAVDRGEPPRRLNIDPASPDYDKNFANVGVLFNGKIRKGGDIVAYDADMCWIRVHLKDNRGRPKRERGVMTTMILRGKVEPFWKDQPAFI